MIIDMSEITTALLAAGIVDYEIVHPRTTIESAHVTRPDGRTIAFGPSTTETDEATEGIDVAYYVAGVDSDVRTQDWVRTVDELVADVIKFRATSETQKCRTCGKDVVITRDENGMVQQTDGQGDIICESCWGGRIS